MILAHKPAKITTAQQDRPVDWLRDHPEERWRCDIFPHDGSDHHGIGATEAEAIFQASLAYGRWLTKLADAAKSCPDFGTKALDGYNG